MGEEKLTEIRSKMVEAMGLIQQAVDTSLPMIRDNRDGVVNLWEEFLKGFFTYVREKSDESQQNLLSYISFKNVWMK